MSTDDDDTVQDGHHALEWWHDLDQPFLAHADMLHARRRYNTRLLAPGVTYDASVVLPQLPKHDYHLAGYLEPPRGWPVVPGDRNEDWGTDYRNQAMGSVGIVVRRLAFVANIPPEHAVPADMRAEWGVDLFGFDIYNEMDTWWENVRTWLEISTGQRLTQVGHQQPEWDPGSKTQIWLVADNAERERWRGGYSVISEGSPVRGVEASTFEACVALSDIQPPLAWNLLRDARALQGVGQHRRAVIDAATAAELAVTQLLDDRLEGTDPEVARALRDDNPMLGRKTRLLSKLGRQLPRSFTDDLVNKRNQAVHKGVDPTWSECEAAIQEALTQVKRVFPLPTPAGASAPLFCRW